MSRSSRWLLCAGVVAVVCAVVESSWTSCPTGCAYSIGSYSVNLTALQGTWEAVYFEDISSFVTVPVFFNISVCGPLSSTAPTPAVCKGGHVCYTEDFQEFTNLGAHGSCRYSVDNNALTLSYTYASDAIPRYGVGNVTVSMVCGPTLGVPQVLEGVPNRHVVEILWLTSAACNAKGSTAPKSETKCFNVHPVHNNGLKAAYIDLSGLIKDSGYSATSSERPDLRVDISVCRPMHTNDGCDGSMACLVSGDKELTVKGKHLALSSLTQDSRSLATPHMEGDMLTVEYPISSTSVKGCDKPMVRIRFLCPTGDEVLGPHIDFIDNNLCLINIVWNTMYACEISAIQSKNCKLTTPFGLEFDISGLAKRAMNVTVSAGSSNYQYFLSPCAPVGLNAQCSRLTEPLPIRVTQIDLASSVCRSLGKGNGTLRYADNTLSLTYFSGDACRNGISRTSIITFTCPESVDNSCHSGNCVSFVTENECIYEFEWVTPLACGRARSKFSCEFKLGGLSYDLGRLTEGTNPTYAAVSYENDTECYLINPCGELKGTGENLTPAKLCNLRLVPQPCWNSSVCQIRRNSPLAIGYGTFKGFDKTSLQAFDKNVFSVTTKSSSNGRRALVRYICETGRLQSFPVFISQVVTNVSEFHWATYAACPQVSQVGSNCMVQEKSTGFSFNLTSLSSRSYVFNNTKYSYKFRVCGSLPASECGAGAAMCQSQLSGSNSASCGRLNSTLMYADSSLKLVYSGGQSCKGGALRTTTITFLCNPNTHQPVVENVTEIRHCEYLVEMRTKLACPPAYRATECVLFTPSGTVYDLRELSRLTGNWQAEGSDGSVYVINVCRPLNLQGIGGCNPLSSACRITSNPASPNVDIGYASSASLTVSSTGDYLYLRYNYSTPSSDSQTSHCSKIFTNIKLTCNANAPAESGPHFISGGDDANPCEYTFQWDTRAACPVRKETTHNCSVSDSVTGYTFNLLPIRSHKHHYTVQYTDSSNNKNGSFNVTVCGSLLDKDSKCTAVDGESVCQLDSENRNHSCGLYSSMSLSRIGETLRLAYSGGDKCHHNNHDRSVEIDFVCDYEAADFYGSPSYQQEFANNCSYSFVWPTALACAPRTLTCKASGGRYDLSPLMEAHHWIVSGEKNGYWYVVGGCNSLVVGSDPYCPLVSYMGGCKYKPDVNNTGVNLGFVTGDLVVLGEGHLRLTYHNGEVCSASGLRSVVQINFHCHSGNGAGQPVLLPSSGDCLTQIDWSTEYACPRDRTSNSTWIITNPVTHQTFDLTSIPHQLSSNHTDSGTAYTYVVGLGGHGVPCGTNQGSNIGACQTKVADPTKAVVLGRIGNLTLIDGKIHADYLNGDVCHSTKKPRRVAISFQYAQHNKLVVLPEQQCEYSFIVYTPLVKENTPVIGQECQVDNFEELDWFLSYKIPPIRINSTLSAYISVCRPISLENQADTHGSSSCASSNSGACLVTSSGGTKSLGKPNPANRPTLAPSGNGVIISYSGGDACNSTHTYSAKLLLLCSNNTETEFPELVYPVIDSSHPFSTKPCEFVFQWSSSHACPLSIPSTGVSSTVCSINDPSDGTKFDLSSLANNSYVVAEADNDTYIIGLCGPIAKPPSGCSSNVGICHHLGHSRWMPMVYANHSLTITYHSPHSIEVVYPNGGVCKGAKTWTANINIYCSEKNSKNRPILVSNTSCQLEFSWPTKKLCVDAIKGCYATDPNDPTAVFDLEQLSASKWTGQVVEEDSKHLGYIDLRVCRNLNPTLPEGAHCSQPSGICIHDPVTQKYVNLGYMANPPVVINGSVWLVYTGGDSCGHNNNTAIRTTIQLECHRELTGNQLNLQQVTECLYSGQWLTPLACKETTEDTRTCVLQDPLTQQQYNFKPLSKNIIFQVGSSAGGVNYSVCLCPSSKCAHASLVQLTPHGRVVLGNFTKLMVLPNGESQVLFSNGDLCEGSTKYSATILMQCDRGSSATGRLEYEKGLSFNCHKIFVWWTRVACLTEVVSCTIQSNDNKLFSFPQLYSATGHWQVTDTKTQNTFLLNICGPLHGINDTTCSGGSSVCVKSKGGTYRDLALAGTQQIFMNTNGHPVIHFAGLSSCTGVHHSSISIEMLCGIKGLVYKRNDSCSYYFEWYTTFACGESATSLETVSGCVIKQYQEKKGLYSFDLNKLRKSQSYQVHTKDGTYYFSLCQEASECGKKGISACFKSSSTTSPMGAISSTNITFDSYWMQVRSSSGKAHIVITVMCIDASEDDQEQSSRPPTDQAILESNSEDQWVYFKIYTTYSTGCSKRTPPTTNPPTTAPADTNKSSSNKAAIAGAIIAVVSVVVLLLVVITILWNKNRRAYLHAKFCHLFASKSNERVVYVRLPKPEHQLLEESDESSDNEEEEEDTRLDAAALVEGAATAAAATANNEETPAKHSDDELLKL